MRVGKRVIGAMIVSGLLSGCSGYYRVTDPTSGTVYYTKDVGKRDGGAVEFTDARTRSKVTLQSSEVAEISERDFRAAVGPE
jgi:hypothetical protein